MTKNESASDALVDTYRSLLAMNVASRAAAPATPGAGVDPAKVIRPGKRIRNWHRNAAPQMSLRSYASAIAGQDKAIAVRWFANKARAR